jgi:hypothetical protein
VDNPSKSFWVQDGLEATAFNGVYVFLPSSADPVEGLVVGATMNVEATVTEYKCQAGPMRRAPGHPAHQPRDHISLG